jgi:sugar phosphate isomerase/epimerase
MSGPFRLGLCSVTFRALAPAEVIDVAVAAGIEGIEWGADVHVPPGDEHAASAVAKRCAESGVAIPSYGSYLVLGGQDDRTGRRARPERLAQVLATAVELGAGNVRVWCPFGAPPGSDEDLFARAAADLAAWSSSAADAGLTISLEYHVDTFTETAESAAALLAAAGSPPNLFTYWQPVAGRPLLDEARAIADHVSHVHVFHWEAGGERRPLAEGDHWPALLDVLRGPTRWAKERFAFLEFVRDDDPAQLVADAATLRSWR